VRVEQAVVVVGLQQVQVLVLKVRYNNDRSWNDCRYNFGNYRKLLDTILFWVLDADEQALLLLVFLLFQ
jgi:hypothetical protein